MTTIWKYPLEVVPQQVIQIPLHGQILAVQAQQGGPLCLWAKVDSNPELTKQPRTIQVFGTGHQIPAGLPLDYIGTVQQGPLVWHVFEVLKEEGVQ